VSLAVVIGTLVITAVASLLVLRRRRKALDGEIPGGSASGVAHRQAS